MKIDYGKTRLEDREDIRKKISEEINDYIKDNLCPEDIFERISSDVYLYNRIKSLNEKELERFENKIFKLIKMSIRNVIQLNKKMIPLYIIT